MYKGVKQYLTHACFFWVLFDLDITKQFYLAQEKV